MKRIVLSVFTATVLAFGSASPALADPGGATPAASASVVSPGLPGSVRVVVDDPMLKVSGGDQPVGPQTFAVDSGKVYVHDQAHGALRIYTLAGAFVRSVSLPPGLAVLDLAVRGSAVKVLDLDGGVHTLSLAASSAVETGYSATGTVAGMGVSRIGWFGDQLVGQVVSEGQLVLSKGTFLGEPVGAVIGAVNTSVSGNTVGLTSAGAAKTRQVTVPNTPVDAYEAFRENGFSYDVVTDERQAGEVWLEDSWVFRYDADGVSVASYSLAAQSWYTPSREFTVSDGHVYQLLIGATHAQVVELGPDRPGTLAAASVTAADVAAPLKAAGVPGRRVKQVLARATSMTKVTWTYKESAHGRLAICSKPLPGPKRKVCNQKKIDHWIVPANQAYRVELAPQLAAITAKKAKVKAYPYAWGGYDTDVTHSEGASWKNFAKALKAKKVFVSNVKGPRGTSWVYNTAGVDCSGFITSVFGMGAKRGTGNLVDGKHFKRLMKTVWDSHGKKKQVPAGLADALPGDILNRAGHHVMLVVGWVDSETVKVVESTTTSRYGKVKTNQYSIKDLDDHYVAARYQHWLADPPPYCASDRVWCIPADGGGAR